MCSSRQIISPSGGMFNENQKWMDPLGVTDTAIGDPTGRIRKERAAVKRENQAPFAGTILGWKNLEGRFRSVDGSVVGG